MVEKWEMCWANGCERVVASSFFEAITRLKTNPNKILTGWLVRGRRVKRGEVWAYLDAGVFWKKLKLKGDTRG